jgi:hypothetical protein
VGVAIRFTSIRDFFENQVGSYGRVKTAGVWQASDAAHNATSESWAGKTGMALHSWADESLRIVFTGCVVNPHISAFGTDDEPEV